MARGKSGRVVIELDPAVKQAFQQRLDTDRITAKSWVLRHIEDYLGTASRPDELRIALDKSVHLQAHYAELLNMHDGGERIVFADADAWIARLRKTRC